MTRPASLRTGSARADPVRPSAPRRGGAAAPLVASIVFAAAAVAVIVVIVVACPGNASDEEERTPAMLDPTRIGPRLRQVVATAPDSVVGVFVRTREDTAIDAEAREELEAVGLRIGTVAGTIMTGRIVARDVPRLARVRFVVYIQLSERIPVPRPPADVARDSAGGA